MSERSIEAVNLSPTGNSPSSPTIVLEAPSTTSALTSVASAIVTTPLLASNPARRGFTVYNESTQILYLALFATASLTAYTLQMVPGSYFEVPFRYTGAVSGIWPVANGFARITELLP
jgi:hypothetical protein